MKAIRVLLGLLGTGIIAFALRGPSLGLVRFEALQGTQITLLVLGGLLLAVALLGKRFPQRRLGQAYQQGAVLLLNTLLFFALLELAIIMSFNMQLIGTGSRVIGGVNELPEYQREPWVAQLGRDYAAVERRLAYKPFSLWQRDDYQGETITILDDGSRSVPGSACDSAEAYRIFVYGGSTIWGVAVPDWETIPAHMQTLLGGIRPTCVVNFGELGNVSTQNMIRLIQELQAGNVPDMVIFYDGVNDVIASTQTGIAGAHRNYTVFSSAMTQVIPPHPLIRWISESTTFKFLMGLLPQSPAEEIDYEALAQTTADYYLTNVRVITALGETYGFETVFFWQPVLVVERKPRTPAEEDMASVVENPLLAMYRDTWTAIKTAAPQTPNLYYVADALDSHAETLYFDHHHLLPAGNALIASRIVDAIRPALSQD